MSQHPGIGLGDVPVLPDRQVIQQLAAPEALQALLPYGCDIEVAVLAEDTKPRLGARLFVVNRRDYSLRQITGGAVVLFGSHCYQLTVAHAFRDARETPQSPIPPKAASDDCDFDGMSDDDLSDNGDDGVMATGSVTSDESDKTSFTTGLDGAPASETSSATTPRDVMDSSPEPRSSPQPDPPGSDVTSPDFSCLKYYGQMINRLSALDYAFIELAATDTTDANDLTLTGHQTISGFGVIGTDDTLVFAAMPRHGIVSGTLIPTPTFIRFSGEGRFQRVYPLHLDKVVNNGDCGTPVMDQKTCDLYGQIVAGGTGSRVAYLAPVGDAFQHIEKLWAIHFGLQAKPFGNPTPARERDTGQAVTSDHPDASGSTSEHSKLPSTPVAHIQPLSPNQRRVPPPPSPPPPSSGSSSSGLHAEFPLPRVPKIRFERMTEAEARESLSEYFVFRFEKAIDSDPGVNKTDSGWWNVIRTELPGIPKREMIQHIRRLNRETYSLTQKRNTLNESQLRQLDQASEELARGLDPRFCVELVQIDHQLRPKIRPVIKESGRHEPNREGKKTSMERIALLGYYRRSLRPDQDAISLINQHKRPPNIPNTLPVQPLPLNQPQVQRQHPQETPLLDPKPPLVVNSPKPQSQTASTARLEVVNRSDFSSDSDSDSSFVSDGVWSQNEGASSVSTATESEYSSSSRRGHTRSYPRHLEPLGAAQLWARQRGRGFKFSKMTNEIEMYQPTLSSRPDHRPFIPHPPGPPPPPPLALLWTPEEIEQLKSEYFERGRAQGIAESRDRAQAGTMDAIYRHRATSPQRTAQRDQRHVRFSLPSEPVLQDVGSDERKLGDSTYLKDTDSVWRDEARKRKDEALVLEDEAFNPSEHLQSDLQTFHPSNQLSKLDKAGTTVAAQSKEDARASSDLVGDAA